MDYSEEVFNNQQPADIQSIKSPGTMPLFRRLSEDEYQTLNMNSIKLSFKKGEIINKQGAFASHIFFIARGIAKTYIENGDKNLILSIAPAGSLVGLQSITTDHVFHYSAKALTDTDIYSYDINIIKNLMHQNPLFSSEIIEIINQNLLLLYDRFFSLTQKQLHGRLADILLCLAYKIFKSPEFDLNMSRKDLAELTGMSTESAIRILKNFKDDRIIGISGKRLKIIELDKLKRISATG
jgi:CRP/FNR family transcriptional regulator, polysaccharide utilization system transcription regulator